MLGLMFRLSCLCFCSDWNLNLKCPYLLLLLFLKFNDENFVMRILFCLDVELKSEFFFLCHNLKVLEVFHNF